MIRPDFIETFTGRRFCPLEPVSDDIDIRDIAHALSHQCRFSGHTLVHYSVAEHSVRVSELLKSWGCSQMIQTWGLLHDASEAYLVDIPSPLKHSKAFEAYREAESRLMVAVARRFDLPIAEPERVGHADATLLATEARDLMPHRAEHWSALKERPLVDRLVPWTSVSAKKAFLKTFEVLAA